MLDLTAHCKFHGKRYTVEQAKTGVKPFKPDSLRKSTNTQEAQFCLACTKTKCNGNCKAVAEWRKTKCKEKED